MKKLVRKTMFVLSFLGLFTFAAPKQAKAAENPTWPRTMLICCPDGHCQYVFCENEAAYKAAYSFNCTDNHINLDD